MKGINSKICIISCYFGKLPETYPLWIESCKYNETIDFLLVTDQYITLDINNVKIINTTLEEFTELINNKLKINSNIKKPHKICDYKPMYGLILSEYLESYDFWGHCDLDMIFGDLRKYITEDILNKNDKIYPLGHLSLYRNKQYVNNRVFDKNDKISFEDVLKDSRTLGYDEMNGIYNIYKKKQYPMYEEFEFADITHRYNRFKLSCSYRDLNNYNKQLFYWKEGKVYRIFIKENKVCTEEFSYIHFQKRSLKIINDDIKESKTFLITNLGLIKLESGNIDESYITKFNRYRGNIYENIESKFFDIRNYLRAIKNKLLILKK